MLHQKTFTLPTQIRVGPILSVPPSVATCHFGATAKLVSQHANCDRLEDNFLTVEVSIFGLRP